MSSTPNKTIEQQLVQTWKQERRFCHLRGLCRCVIWLILLLFLALLIDWGLLFKARMPAIVSVLLGVAGLATMVWVVWREWLVHLRPYNATRVALQVEAKHPELMSSLSSYTQMDGMVTQSQASPQLIEAMRDFAVQQARKLAFRDIVDFAQIKKLVIYAAMVLIIAGVLSVRWSDYLGAMAKRVAGIDADYPIQTQLVEISGDMTLAQGSPVEIEVKAGGVIPSSALLHVRPMGESGGWTEMPMDKLANGFTFRRALDAPDGDLHYYVTMGDYRSEPFAVSVVRAPRIVQAQVELTYPEYLDRPKATSDQLNQEVPEGTRIQWKLRSDKPVGNLGVVFGDDRLEAQIADNGTDITFSMTADRNIVYTFEWTEGVSGNGFTFNDVEYSVKTIKDTVPRITFNGRPPQGIATANKTAKVAWQAKDDYGLSAVWLVYTLTTPGQSEAIETQRILLQDASGRLAEGAEYAWVPAEHIFALSAGVEISYYLETADLKPDGERERVARSQVKQLAIVSNAEYIAWFRRELAQRNDAVTGVFRSEIEASKQIKQLLPEKDGDQP